MKITIERLEADANVGKVAELVANAIPVPPYDAEQILKILPYHLGDFDRTDETQMRPAIELIESLTRAGAVIQVSRAA